MRYTLNQIVMIGAFVCLSAACAKTNNPIANKLTTDAAFMASTSVGSGVPLTYEVSGPATISGTEIALTDSEGTATLTSQGMKLTIRLSSWRPRSFQDQGLIQ